MTDAPVVDYEELSAQLVRALRGRRSQAGLSKRLGYGSNIVYRWESRQCWPTAARFLEVCRRVGVDVGQSYERMLQRRPPWLLKGQETSPAAAAGLLRALRGKTPIRDLASALGTNRFTVSRWFKGTAQPRLPQFLALIEACSGRLCDFVATLCMPGQVPCIASRWDQLRVAREIAYAEPWSHGVLRALQLDACPRRGRAAQTRWIAERLGLPRAAVERLLSVLIEAGQVERLRDRFRPPAVQRVDTSFDPARARALKASWIRVAADRLEQDAPGSFVYSLFEVSAEDLERLRDLQQQYARAMQAIIAQSRGTNRVGLLCAQLLDLGAPAHRPG